MKFISSMIKEANRVDLMFPEVLTLTGVHKKAEEWMERASIALRTKMSLTELESLVSTGDNLPLNVSDVLEKLKGRLEQAREWIRRVEEIVPKSDDVFAWLKEVRLALNDGQKSAHLLSLMPEGARIPVHMECMKLLQIEIDARNWTIKAKSWIPDNLNSPEENDKSSFKRGKIDDVGDHLERASSLHDRIRFKCKNQDDWVLDGEDDLTKMYEMAESWLEKYDEYISGDNRRKDSRIRVSMSKLHAIISELNRIPLNLGNPSVKINRIYSQAEEWMMNYFSLVKRCGIECSYSPNNGADEIGADKAVKIAELEEAVYSAESDISVDLEEAIEMKDLLKKTQLWMEKSSAIVPKRSARKKKRGNGVNEEKHKMMEISNLIEEAATIPLDIADELERLKIEHSVTFSWRLQAHRTIRDIIAAFEDFRKEKSSIYSSSEVKAATQAVTISANDGKERVDPKLDTKAVASSSLREQFERRTSRSDSISTDITGTSGSATPITLEVADKNLFSLVSALIRSSKSLNAATPEEKIADELNEVISWFSKSFKIMDTSSEVFDRKNFSKLDKLIESGRKLLKFKSFVIDDIPEDPDLVNDLRQSWAAVMGDDIERLCDLQIQRGKFLEWCEKADEIVSSSDKKIPIETLKELAVQSAAYPPSSEVVLRVKKRAEEATAWAAAAEEIIKTGKRISMEEAKEITDKADKLNITCQEYKTLRNALRTTRGWIIRVKKCGAANGQTHVTGVTELINEHSNFIVTAMEEVSKLKQAMCGYCICRLPYEGFMIGCDGCGEWYHGPCVGVNEEQAEKFDKYVCVRCYTLRVYKENTAAVAGIVRKWSSAKGLSKARSMDSQRYGRKVRQAERDISKSKSDLEKFESELRHLVGPKVPNNATNFAPRLPQSSEKDDLTGNPEKTNKKEKDIRDKIEKARTTIENCEKRLEGYKVELVERKNLEAREDALTENLRKWCSMVKREVLSPMTKEDAEKSRPGDDGYVSDPMKKTETYAAVLLLSDLPDVDSVLNSFKILSWCLHSLSLLRRKPRVEEIRSLLSHSDSGYFKLPEAKCVRMLRSMASRAQLWQAKARKAIMPIPDEKRPFDLNVLRELILSAKQIPFIMPEEARIWSTIEDNGLRHCICGGPSDGSFMLGCDSCDKWFHGSCMEIDKETGDALSKWICPMCSNSPLPKSEQNQNETFAISTEDLKISIVDDRNADISPHAPDPKSLWPPFGLRRSEQAIQVLGEPGDSDVEDFDPNTVNLMRTPDNGDLEKSSRSLPDNSNVLLVASVASLAAPMSQEPFSPNNENSLLAEAAQSIALMSNSNAFNLNLGGPSYQSHEKQSWQHPQSHSTEDVKTNLQCTSSTSCATKATVDGNTHSTCHGVSNVSNAGGDNSMLDLVKIAESALNEESTSTPFGQISSAGINANVTPATQHHRQNHNATRPEIYALSEARNFNECNGAIVNVPNKHSLTSALPIDPTLPSDSSHTK